MTVRPAIDVADRVLALALVAERVVLEARLGLRAGDAGRWESLAQWADAEFVFPACSPRERELLARPPGAWSAEELDEMSWQREALAALLWALGSLRHLPEDASPIPAAALPELPVGRPTAPFRRTRADRPG